MSNIEKPNGGLCLICGIAMTLQDFKRTRWFCTNWINYDHLVATGSIHAYDAKSSYKLSDCCAAECICEGNEETEPCYGEVDLVGEEDSGNGEYTWIHACVGHKEWPGNYVPEYV